MIVDIAKKSKKKGGKDAPVEATTHQKVVIFYAEKYLDW